jgi:hypothetical protein
VLSVLCFAACLHVSRQDYGDLHCLLQVKLYKYNLGAHCYQPLHTVNVLSLLHLAGCRSAWVGAHGNNTLRNPAAPNTNGAEAQPGSASQRPKQPSTATAAVPAPRLNVPQPETMLRWLDGRPVGASLLQRLVALPSVWSAHDVIWSIQVGVYKSA